MTSTEQALGREEQVLDAELNPEQKPNV